MPAPSGRVSCARPPALSGRIDATIKLTMTTTSARLDYLDALRAVLVFFVVCIHALGYATIGPGPVRSAIDLIVSPIAVQGFYLVDGLLFARRLEGGIGASRYLADSARRLLWPWILFGIVYVAARYVAELQGIVEP